ncbi:hypothetical protein [Shewanella sp.]|uniref:hypothetical protein n=1 Tax=Shewanella sp. TaxID=50422 RepID=UPI003567B681
MDSNKLIKLRELLCEVANSPTKKQAAISSKSLDFMVSSIIGSLNGYTSGKLREAVSSAKSASGISPNKQSDIDRMNNSWYVFENDIEHSLSGKADKSL